MIAYFRHGIRKNCYYNHIPARSVKELIGEKVWNSYYKFCITRNPWDRLISEYFWQYKTEPRPSFSDFIHSKAPERLNKEGFGAYTIDYILAVDKVCRYETLATELEEVRIRLGIPEPLELPHAKSGFRKDRRNYRDYYSLEDRDRVAKLFADEIALMNYKF